MKRFTIIFSILLVLGFAGSLAYVASSPDFVDPAGAAASGEDMDAPIWSMTVDEVLAELESQGLVETDGLVNLAASGLCTVAVKVTNGAELYWWDLENLDENSMEYKSYQQLKEEGIIDIYGSESIISLSSNGPFGLLLSFCEGDVDALDKAFRAVGQTGGGAEDPNAPVWTMTMDDMMDYLEEKSLWNRDEMLPLAGGVATEGYVYNNIELYWWDVDNLEEGSDYEAAYQDALAGEPIDLYQQGRTFMPVTKNGPFAIFTSYYTGDVDALLAAFEAFGRE